MSQQSSAAPRVQVSCSADLIGDVDNGVSRLSVADMEKLERLKLRNDYDLRTAAEATIRPDQLPLSIRYTLLNVLADAKSAAPAEIEALLYDPEKANAMLGGGRIEGLFMDAYRDFVSLPSARQAYRPRAMHSPGARPELFSTPKADFADPPMAVPLGTAESGGLEQGGVLGSNHVEAKPSYGPEESTMKREISSSKPVDHELTDEELNVVTGGSIWDAIVAVFYGGADASHKHAWREGGGPRGA